MPSILSSSNFCHHSLFHQFGPTTTTTTSYSTAFSAPLLVVPRCFLLISLLAVSVFAQQSPAPSSSSLLFDESCPTNVCFHGGICFIKRAPDGSKEFECECPDGFGGDLCELKCTLPCQNGGKCRRSSAKGEWCECPHGFAGTPLCSEREELDCRHSPCPFAHICLANPETGRHHCEWDLCIRWGSPCSNNATCRPIKDDFICDCSPGYRGRQCTEDIDECDVERGKCQNGATCENTAGSFRCRCPPGFNGPLCDQVSSVCDQQSPCGDRGECRDLANGDYACRCHGNLTGKNCDSQPPPSACPTPFVANKNGTNGAAECVCPPEKTGDQCELDVANCNDDGPGTSGRCENGGECIGMGPKTFCICPTGFTGPRCEKSEEGQQGSGCLVRDRECLNGGRCIRRENGQTLCKCKGQFTGTWCDRPLRLTAGKTTELPQERTIKVGEGNGTTAPDAGKGITTGVESTTTITPPSAACTPNPCQNGGVCFPMDDGQSHCHCPFGRSTGKFCQLQCHCPRGQGCTESAVEPGGRVECFRQGDRQSAGEKPKNEEKEEGEGGVDGDDEEEEELAKLLPSEEVTTEGQKEGEEEDDKKAPNNFDIFEEANNGTDGNELVLGGGKLQLTTSVGNISSCSECVNAVKCLLSGDRIKCLCSADYTGPLCDMTSPLCASLDCSSKPGHRCLLPNRGNPLKADTAVCGCPPGLTGPRCARPTVLGFSRASTLLLQSERAKKATTDYKLALTFRTTLPRAHLASGDTLLGHLEFSLWLHDDGQLLLRTGTNQSQEHRFSSELRLNDADWYEVRVWSTAESGTGFELRHSESAYLLACRTLSGSPLFAPIWNTRLGQRNHEAGFIGCMRNISLNGRAPVEADDERAFGIEPGCNRREQCPPPPSNGADNGKCANGGRCIDLWDAFACQCPRPFLPPTCAQQIRELTFGHGNSPSMSAFTLGADDKASVAETTKISFLIRTNQQRNSPIFFLGETLNASEPEETTTTFIGGELQKGTMRVNVRLGGKMVFPLRSSVPINDNRVHLVEIEREGNGIMLRVDQKAEPLLRLARPFPHPLLANQLIIGTTPTQNGPPMDAALTNGTTTTASFFKGTIQDFRVNDHFVLFDDPPEGTSPEDLPHFGQKQSDLNLLQGTVSDDVCALGIGEGQSPPCGSHGQCRNTFNDFACQCEPGWMGTHCQQRDFCGFPTTAPADQLCTKGSKCENVDGGFVCISTATLTPNSAIRYTMNPGNVIKSSAKHANITLEFRTRTQDGNLLKLQSPTESLVVQLRQGLLFLTTSTASNLSLAPSPISHQSNFPLDDGQWHKLVVRQQTAPNGLQIWADNDEEKAEMFATNFSIKRVALDGQARISVGRLTEQQGFKGCLRNIRLGTLPPLSFLGPQEAPQMADSLASIPHFELQRAENVRTNEACHSEDVCAKNPCLNGGRCEDKFNLMQCQCLRGIEGEFCELQKDECDAMNGHQECRPHGRCVDELNGFRCQCTPGFTGPKCKNEEELCRADSCKNSGKCRTVNGTLQCECPSKFIGQWCQLEAGTKCSEEPCQNGAQCFQSAHGEIACSCRPGFIGPLCELRIDPCKEMPCMNGGKCISSTTLMNSSASSSLVDFHCDCPREFAGILCDRLADTCGRMDNGSCSGHGRCENVWGGQRCDCFEGWRGRDCSIGMDICLEEMPCQNGGTCLTDQNNPNHFRCQCPPFHLGEHCEIAGVCAENPCQNGGECLQTSPAEHICRCTRGFQGAACEQRIDFCDADPCLNGATCQPLVGDFSCQCIPGFAGKRCELDIDECQLPPPSSTDHHNGSTACLHGGRCSDRVNGFECNCQGTGYKGSRCEQDIDECGEAALNCQNGLCMNLPGSYRCECKPGYIGQRCHFADPCVPNPLTNRSSHNCAHGECVGPRVMMGAAGREFATHDCECLPGYTGELCMRLVEAQHAMTLSNFIGLGIVVLLLCLSLGALLYLFVGCTRRKRANQGTYSPSNQEMTGQARFVGSTGRRPAIIHPNENLHPAAHHHKPRRKN